MKPKPYLVGDPLKETTLPGVSGGKLSYLYHLWPHPQASQHLLVSPYFSSKESWEAWELVCLSLHNSPLAKEPVRHHLDFNRAYVCVQLPVATA